MAKNQTFIDDTQMRRKMQMVRNVVEDISPALHTIARMFYQSRRTIFALKGPGQYKDLTPKYSAFKVSKYGFNYPILKASGRLERSITQMGSSENVTIITKKDLIVGTSVPYAKYHNSRLPRKKMPFRPFVFWGPEAPATMRNMTSETKNLYARAYSVLLRYVKKSLENLR